MIHFSNNDTLFKRYTFRIMIHFSNNDTLTNREIHLPKGDTLTKGRYTFQIMIHLSNNDTLFK